MENATCHKAFTQVTDEAIVYIKISGFVNGTAAYRDCKLQRLRTQAGGRNVIHELRTVADNGTSADSPDRLTEIKEANRYQIDDCRDASRNDDPVQLTTTDSGTGTPALGLLDVSDSQWAQLRVHSATEDELKVLPDSWDERDAVSCPNAQAIQIQGKCGEPLPRHTACGSAGTVSAHRLRPRLWGTHGTVLTPGPRFRLIGFGNATCACTDSY